MGGLLLKLQNFKKVKLIFGHPVLVFFPITATYVVCCALDFDRF